MFRRTGYGDYAAVDAALAHLRLEPADRQESTSFQLFYRTPELRPISIERDIEPAQVRRLVDEELDEWLGVARGHGAERVRAHLNEVREVVTLELGSLQLEGMGLVLANEVARWIAAMAGGYIKDADGVWWEIDNWSYKRIYPES